MFPYGLQKQLVKMFSKISCFLIMPSKLTENNYEKKAKEIQMDFVIFMGFVI